ncbi:MULTISPECIES: DUF397 domain-containing protein [Streptomyces]|uniref:DUF397 domain-containing protein n=1 Tax=Streptomyces TaxID=1883 RepID=UPI002243411C|nr:DUF397 domain-containing protein [Streptomyces griseolus]MCW8218815.1 DUF397 domain-containing protein [Streptomyces griseolus]
MNGTELTWFKSSYSDDESACLEIAVAWTKSTYSGNEGGDCVEVAACPHAVHVRDSKDLTVPALTVSPDAWSAFVAGGWNH